jgi:hypothetical protein
MMASPDVRTMPDSNDGRAAVASQARIAVDFAKEGLFG